MEHRQKFIPSTYTDPKKHWWEGGNDIFPRAHAFFDNDLNDKDNDNDNVSDVDRVGCYALTYINAAQHEVSWMFTNFFCSNSHSRNTCFFLFKNN